MLLDLWEWFLLLSDGIDLVFSNLASGTYPVPISFILVILFFGLISFFAWRSTDIPDLPAPPRPPYVIQITAGPGSGVNRQTIADVRLLTGGAFFDGSEIINRYHTLSRNQATNTDPSSQPTTSTGAIRNVGGRGSILEATPGGPNFRRRIPGRSFLLGLFRRQNPLARPVQPGAVQTATIRSQPFSPNLVVYHRVNVYHHHIHSHLGHSVNNNNPQANRPVTNSSQGQQNQDSVNVHPVATRASSSSVPPVQSLSNPPNSDPPQESSSILTSNSRVEFTEPTVESTLVSSDAPVIQSSESSSPTDSSNPDTVDARVSGSGTVRFPTTAISRDQLQHLNLEDPSSSSPEINKMPASNSDGQGHAGTGDAPGDHSFIHEKSATATVGSSIGGGSGAPSPSTAGGEDVHFTIKFLNDTQMDVTSQLGEKIVDFKRRHFATEMAENKTVRLIFNGRVLDNDSKTLREFGIFDQCVVHCLIVNRQQNQNQPRSGGAGGAAGRNNLGAQDAVPGNMRRVVGLPEPGMFFVAFIGIFLVFLWFICLHFGQHLFTQSAVVSLTVLTAIFLIGIVACYLPLPTN